MKFSVFAKILPVCLLLAGSEFVWSLSASEVPQYTSRFWRTRDGLPHNSVFAMTQTSDGYIWVGTAGGLARFDGLTFHKFDLAPALAKESVSVNALCQGQDRSLWMGVAGHGVVRLQDGVVSSLTTNGLPKAAIRTLFAASDGTIWIGLDVGLARFKNEKVEGLARIMPPGLGVNAFCEDAGRTIYLGTTLGMKVLPTRKGLRVENLPSTLPHVETANINEAYIRTLCLDRTGNLWAGADRALVRLDTALSARIEKGLSHDFISAVLEDRHGNLWVGTFGGLNQIPANRDTPVEITNDGDSFDMVNSLLEDREGNIWVGTADGLVRLQPKSFSVFDRHRGLSHNNVISVMEDRHGRICVGTRGGGLNFIQDGQVAPGKETIAGDTLVMAMAQDVDGGIWLTSENFPEVYCRTEAGIVRYGEADGFNDKNGRVIRQDRSGVLWIGTSGGLYSFAGGKFQKWTSQDGLSANSIHDICEDRNGNLWIATDQGLNRKQGGRFVPLAESSQTRPMTTTAIHEDTGDEKLWLGTRKGLALWQNERFVTRPDLTDPVFHENVLGILEDNEGNLWITSTSGIRSAPKQALEAALYGQNPFLKSMTYDVTDGLLSDTCNGAAKPACWKSRDGRLWFATAKGLAVIDPKSARRINAMPPPVSIEQVIADKQRFEVQGSTFKVRSQETHSMRNLAPGTLNLKPGKGELEFHYTALSFTAPEKNRFKYKLEGLDSEWVEAGTRRVANYNNLKPGSYNFQVMGCNNDDVWSESVASVKLVLQPHYWQTWWFKFSLGFASLSLAIAGARYVTRQRMQSRLERLEQQHAVEKERTRIAQEMHDDLGVRLTELLLVGDRARKLETNPQETKSLVGKMEGSIREAVDSLDAIVWAVNPQNDSLDRFVPYIYEYMQAFLATANIRLSVDIPDELPNSPLSAEVRHCLYMVVREALNNVVKHAAATEVRFALTSIDSHLRIVIEDNGKGFSPETISSNGNGLRNMRMRMEKIDGRLEQHSETGKGTRIEVEIPLV